MLRSKRLLRLAALAVACTLFVIVIATHGAIGSAVTSLVNDLANPRQLLERMTFSQRVTLLVDGQERQLWTGAHTVQEAIRAAGVTLGPWDRTEPGLSESISDNQSIKLIRVEQQVVEEQVVVAYRTVKVPSRALNKGQTKEVRAGINGQVLNTYQVLLENGQPVKRELQKSLTLVQEQDRLVEEGIMATLSRGGQVYRYSKMINANASAYTADYNPAKNGPDDPWVGITSTGQKAVAGLTIATDPRVIPMNTRVYVEGIDSTGRKFSGIYVAMDTGGAIKGNDIDIFMSTHQQASNFGRRTMRVYILE